MAMNNGLGTFIRDGLIFFCSPPLEEPGVGVRGLFKAGEGGSSTLGACPRLDGSTAVALDLARSSDPFR